VQIAPIVFFDAGSRVDSADFQPLPSGEGSIVELQQMQRGFGSLPAAGREERHRQLSE
jgi:hypothetical protein